ncbi:hypothetical protein AYR66_02795 [Noviherbaspirillum denitrificans]|uniref:Uncharacterized protein n=1 Tax=Noviherbaspirillum denitrificans TaxID=1968433 RepID=A0A254TC37_9BURK|nr:hypothetical protein AYR66_02795 [Noviherbaspirillum denitrificans]
MLPVVGRSTGGTGAVLAEPQHLEDTRAEPGIAQVVVPPFRIRCCVAPLASDVTCQRIDQRLTFVLKQVIASIDHALLLGSIY